MTDQPGRMLAVFFFGPILVFKGVRYNDYFIVTFGLLLIVWDLFWLMFREPLKKASTPQDVVKVRRVVQ